MDEEKKPKLGPDAKPEPAGGEPEGTSGEETKAAAKPALPSEDEFRPEKEKPAPEKPAKSPKSETGPEKPAAAAEGETAPEKPAAKPAAKAAAKPSAKPAAKPGAKPVRKPPPKRRPVKGPQYQDLEEDELLAELQKRFPEAGIVGRSFLEQNIYEVPSDALLDVLIYLRDEATTRFDYLIDATALDYLGDEKRFCLVYQLYAYPEGPLIRVKSRLAQGEVAPSVTSIWKTADWLEREIWDMFGIEFSGHPDLKRILLPEDWHGHPLRKDYDIKLQDQTWIRKHLRIRKVPN